MDPESGRRHAREWGLSTGIGGSVVLGLGIKWDETDPGRLFEGDR